MKSKLQPRIWSRPISLLLAIILAASMVAPALAEDTGASTPPPAPPPATDYPTGIEATISPSSLELVVGESKEISITQTLTGPEGFTDPGQWSQAWELAGGATSADFVETPSGNATTHTLTGAKAGSGTLKLILKYTYTDENGAKQVLTNDTATCSVTVTEAPAPPAPPPPPSAPTGITLSATNLALDPGKEETLAAIVTPAEADQSVTWTSANGNIATVDAGGKVRGVAAGKTTITATTGNALTAVCTVEVKGVTLSNTTLSIVENKNHTLTPTVFGAAGTDYVWNSNNSGVASVEGGVVRGVSPGTTTITVLLRNTSYSATCTVTVTENTADIISASADIASPLRFSDIKSAINSQCSRVLGSSLQYVTGLTVPVSAGTLYYGYDSADRPGEGVASTKSYYYSDSGGNLRLSNVAFVPLATYSGSVDIQYTGYSASGRTFRGVIRASVSKTNDVTYSTSARQPVYFSAADFNKICNERTGRTLSSVRFTLPSSDRGTLYYNYRGSASYDSRVTSGQDYGRTGTPALDNVTFVPADNYTGTVTISYTGKDAGNGSYSGRVTIAVSGSGGGDVSYSVSSGSYVRFDDDDFNKFCRGITGRTLDYVYFSLPSSSQGTLYYNYRSSGSYDHRVSESTRYYRSSSSYISNVYFVPNTNYSGSSTISFTAYDTNGERVTGVVSVRVDDNGDGENISYSCSKNGKVTFRANDFNSASLAYNNRNLNYVRFELPSSSRGTLYYNYSSSSNTGSRVSSSTNYYRSSSNYLDNVTFVPYSNYTGTVDIDYTGWDTNGGRFDGSVTIRVGTGASGDLRYTVPKNGSVSFDADDFNEFSRDDNGYNLNYVRFTLPSSSKGTLYYNYRSSGSYDHRVSSSTSYYRSSSPSLDNVSFVPYSNYTGTVEIDFTGYDTDGNRLSGVVTVEVGSGASAIDYTVSQNGSVNFDVDDFNDAARDANGNNLNYVRFTLPSSSKGTLYYNYRSSGSYDSRVSSSTSYYRSSNPYLDNVFFVPASNYTGTVTIPYTGYTTNGANFTGTVTVRVGNSAHSDTVSYKTLTNKPVVFVADDFNSISRSYDGKNLNYVRFTLPSTSQGTLYYNYKPSSKTYDSRVSASTSYYRNSSPYLYNITFVPASGYSGTATFAFTGYDTSSGKFSGKVSISVQKPVAQAVKYSSAGGAVTFRPSDFNGVCRTLTGEDVAKVRFTPPSSSYGKMYHNYRNANQYDSLVSSGSDYFYNRSPQLSGVTFVPTPGYSGTVSIPYSGEDANGVTYTGTVEVAVTSSATTQFGDMGNHTWAAPAVAYLYANGVVTGTTANSFSPQASTGRGDFALMIVRAFKFSPQSSGDRFADVPADSYYASAIATARALGVVEGSAGAFRPNAAVSRQDAMLMLQRAMRAAGWSLDEGDYADLAPFSDRSNVASYASAAVGSMVRIGVVQGDEKGRLNPTVSVTRAEMAMILYRALTL